MSHDGGAFVSVGMGMGECQSEDTFVCFGAKPAQKSLCARFPTRPEEDEERQDPRVVNRREGVSDSQEMATDRERRLLS